jgi:hypothetical protein
MSTKFIYDDLKERGYLEDLGVDVNIILKSILKNYSGSLLAGFIGPNVPGISGELRTR